MKTDYVVVMGQDPSVALNEVQNGSATVVAPDSAKVPKKKHIVLLVVGCVGVVILVGLAWAAGVWMSDDQKVIAEREKQIGELNEEITVLQADLEGVEKRLDEANDKIAELTGGEKPREKSLQEQLQEAVDETRGRKGNLKVLEDGHKVPDGHILSIEVKDSSLKPFQTASAHLAGDGTMEIVRGLFWRKGNSGDWHYFGASFIGMDCDAFRYGWTEIFADETCYSDLDLCDGESGLAGCYVTVKKYFE